MKSLFCALLRAFLRCLFQLSFRVRVVDADNTIHALEGLKKSVVIANHASFLDGVLLGLFLPFVAERAPLFIVHTWVAKAWYFRPLLMLVDYLAIEPTNPMAMKQVMRQVDAGRLLVIFPEGRITETGSLMKVYDGPAFIAAKTGASVVAVHIDGAVDTPWGRYRGRLRKHWFPSITLTLSPPRVISVTSTGSARERRRQASTVLLQMMQEGQYRAQAVTTLFTRLCRTMARAGSDTLVVEDVKSPPVSYRQFCRLSLALTRLVLRAAPEVGSAQRLGLLLPNLTATLALILGLGAKGRVPALLNYSAGVDGWEAMCRAATLQVVVSARAFIEQARLADKLTALQQRLPQLKILYLEDLRAALTWHDKFSLLLFLWWSMRSVRQLARFQTQHDPESAAVTLFTSGSEGLPKGVVLSHRAILANIAQIRAVCDLSAEDKVLNALPLFHSFGLTAGALLPILSGASLFLYPSPLHYRVVPEVAYDRNCTVLFGTGTFLAHYGKFAHPYDFYKLRYAVAGAEKLKDEVRDLWFEKFGIRIFEGYGATETAPVLAVNLPLAFRSHTVGKFLPAIEYRLHRVPGIAEGGRLHVRAPNLMSGYLRAANPGVLENCATAEEGDGWYDTGDMVHVDDDGFVHIVGRVKRFAKIAGEMVSLEVVEQLALAASPHKQHAVISVNDSRRGEALCLFTTDGELIRQDLQQTAQERGFSELAVPRQIVRVDAMPLLGTGKTDYVHLAAMLGQAPSA